LSLGLRPSWDKAMKLSVQVIASTLALAASVATAQAAAPAQAEIKAVQAHFLISYRGKTIGKARRVLIAETVKGKPQLTLVISEQFRFGTAGRVAAESHLERKVVMKADWTPLSMEETLVAGGKTIKRSARFLPGKAVFKLEGGKIRTVPFKGSLVAEVNGFALRVRGLLAVGKGMTVAVPDLAQGGIALLRASVIGARTVEGRKGRLLLVNVKAVGSNQEWDLLIDEEGRLVEQSIGDMVRKRVDARAAVLPNRPTSLRSGSVPLIGAPPRFFKLEEMTVVLALPEITKGLVPELPGQKVIESGRRLTVKLSQRRPNGLLPQEKLSAADRKRWLTPAGGDWQDADIKRLAAKITRPAKGDLQKGYLIARWVYKNLLKSLGGPPEASAKQALKARSGDCSEHAALFAALCRASGLPARTAYGLSGSKKALYFHVWSEFHAGGRWVPLDAALGRFGLPASYLTLSFNREQAGVRLFKFYASAKGRVTNYRERRKR
jgi:transglutaminase-like putative cysteine protease